MTAEEADAEEKKGNYCIEEPGKGFRRIVAAPKPKEIVEIQAIRTLWMQTRWSSQQAAAESLS